MKNLDNSCLLIIDVQKGFINRHTAHIPDLVEKEQHKYKHIYISQFFNPEGSFFREILGWNGMNKNSQDFELAFKPNERSIIIRKCQYGFISPTFLNELEKKRIKTVDISGMDTNSCIFKNGIDLLENSVTPRVLIKFCASTEGLEYHEWGIKLLARSIGKQQVV